MVNAAGILSIRAEDTDLDENVKRRVSQAFKLKLLSFFWKYRFGLGLGLDSITFVFFRSSQAKVRSSG